MQIWYIDSSFTFTVSHFPNSLSIFLIESFICISNGRNSQLIFSPTIYCRSDRLTIYIYSYNILLI